MGLSISPPMPEVTINGHTYTNDDLEANPVGVLGEIANDVGDIANAVNLQNAYTFLTPASGDTIDVADGVTCLMLDPGGASLTTLNVVLPPNGVNGQIFEISSSKYIDTLTVTATGKTVKGGVLSMSADGGASWRYRNMNTTWYKRF